VAARFGSNITGKSQLPAPHIYIADAAITRTNYTLDGQKINTGF
jgi:hypothetical protein